MEALDASNTLKSYLVDPPVVALPQPHRQHMIDINASAYVLGGALHQQQNKINLDVWNTVGYCSQTLN